MYPDGVKAVSPQLLIIGVQARPAAFSALRAGLQPLCADLLADSDLRARCHVRRVRSSEFHGNLLRFAEDHPEVPLMYGGPLENQPDLVGELSRQRPLWGCSPASLRLARDPFVWTRMLVEAGIPVPEVRAPTSPKVPGRKWLIKPVTGGSGFGILRWTGPETFRQGNAYVQEYIKGLSCSAIYLGSASGSRFLGATRQFIGEKWANVDCFHYCGNSGPLALTAEVRQALDRLGEALGAGCQLRGLWCLDYILKDNVPWPVEINPRYSASIEVLEYATGLPAMALHRQVFDPDAPEPAWPAPGRRPAVVAKVLWHAPLGFTMPEGGPWEELLHNPGDIHEMPPYADLPESGIIFNLGRPVVTVFTRGDSRQDCRAKMKARLQELRQFFGLDRGPSS